MSGARWTERKRTLRSRAEAARERHASVELGFSVVERDTSIGGGLLAGALAYRLFVLLLPTTLLLVTGLGLYAGSLHKRPSQLVRDVGFHGLIGSEVSQTASGRARALVFLLMIPAVLYALATLYRAIAKVYALVWLGSARSVRVSPGDIGVLAVAFVAQLASGAIVGWVRHGHQYGGWLAVLAYVLLIGGAWLAVTMRLPHRDVRWTALLPGAVLFAVGLFLIGIFDIYVTARLVENRANTYGALGIATALLFSLVLVGRLMVVSAELNASLAEHRVRD